MNSKLIISLALVLATSAVLTACSAPTTSPAINTQPGEIENMETDVEVPSESTGSGTETSNTVINDKLVLTMTELAKHNQATDCWLLVEGKIYDVTPFIATAKHPGGAAILKGCGIDATTLFFERPGSGTPHSDKAQMGLEQYYIGELIKTQ